MTRPQYSNFELLHFSPSYPPKLAFWGDLQSDHGQMMDAPDALTTGHTVCGEGYIEVVLREELTEWAIQTIEGGYFANA